MKNIPFFAPICLLVVMVSASLSSAQTTAFNYQGSLQSSGLPANGTYDFQFALFDSASGGTQVGATLQRPSVAVGNGTFGVSLDFGSGALTGADRYLDISVRQTGGGSFTPLTPRQALLSAPYAVRSLNAGNAATATQLAPTCGGCVTASQIGSVNGSVVTGTIPVASVPAGSGSYIQNQNAGPQASSNFAISGNGSAGGMFIADGMTAITQFNIGIFANRILSAGGAANLFAGINSGTANTTGSSNSFFGASSGKFNTTGTSNTFVGANAGAANTVGSTNSFFGQNAGQSNTIGNVNSFFGQNAGQSNTNGTGNSFFGIEAGSSNTAGSSNSFFGRSAGRSNTTANFNSFFGDNTGGTNTSGDHITLIGSNTNVESDNLSYATAIGSGSVASLSNSIYLGRSGGQDAVRIPGAVLIDGSLVVNTLGSAGSQSICLNAANRVSPCSSSLRYKTNIVRFSDGMSFVNRLKPISFDWKADGMKDVGFGAEDIAKIDPRFVTYNTKGEVEGVKYDRLSVAFVNAFKEQQTQIESQNKMNAIQANQIERLQAEIAELKAVVCRSHRKAAICKTR